MQSKRRNLHCEKESRWEQLSPSLLALCLRASDVPHIGMQVCLSFAKAMMGASRRVTLRVDVEDFKRPGLLRLLGSARSTRASLHLYISSRTGCGSLQSLLRLLQHEHLLDVVSSLELANMMLDAAPASVASVFPNVQDLRLSCCDIAHCALPLSGCMKLRSLVLSGQGYQQRTWPYAWLTQLAYLGGLPTLTSLSLSVPAFSTAFLPLWAGHLTELKLVWDPLLPGQSAPAQAQAWQQALGTILTLTSLRKLELPTCTVATVDSLRALPALQHLYIGKDNAGEAIDTQPAAGEWDGEAAGMADVLINSLLQFPALTDVSFPRCGALHHSYADRPCAWRSLRLETVTPAQLARLPLHSLKQPIRLRTLRFDDPHVTGDDLQAAIANVGRCQAQPSLRAWEDGKFTMEFGNVHVAPMPAALLPTASPLVPQDVSCVKVCYRQLDAGSVASLRQMLPPTVTSLTLEECDMRSSCWPQIARCFPQLTTLNVVYPSTRPSDVEIMGYFCAAVTVGAAGWLRSTGSGAQGDAMHVSLGEPFECDEDWEGYMASVLEVNEQLRLLGLRATVDVHDINDEAY